MRPGRLWVTVSFWERFPRSFSASCASEPREVIVLAEVMFPLTPALSPGGEEETRSRFMVPMCVHMLEVEATHEPCPVTPTFQSAGRAGWKTGVTNGRPVHGPNARPKLEVEATHDILPLNDHKPSPNLRFLCLVFFFLAAFCPFSFAATDRPSIERDAVVVDEKTEAVIKGALKYLASKQEPNGAWASAPEEKQHPVAITGYTLMAFQAAGQLPGEGEYGKNVSAAMQYLLDNVAGDGVIGNRNDGQYMYGHGVAAIALAELYGQTKSAAMRPKLERVIKLIVSSQNPEGGWRYRPVARDADISVTVLQVVALRAAKNAGLQVPQVTIDNAVRYVKHCYHPESGGFTYQPGRDPGFARTAAAIYSLQVCGLYDDPMVNKGSQYLMNNRDNQQWFTYGNFYAAPAQYMIGGQTWAKWYAYMQRILLKDVQTKGDFSHWEPSLDRDGRAVGPIYVTSVYTMILAMPYHYIPLYQR